jgi:hypothetical protein
VNAVAKTIARAFPDFEHMGQLTGFVLRKRS